MLVSLVNCLILHPAKDDPLKVSTIQHLRGGYQMVALRLEFPPR